MALNQEYELQAVKKGTPSARDQMPGAGSPLASIHVTTLPSTGMALCGPGLPDAQYIRAKIPVDAVAGELGLEVFGDMVRCWRPENHQHGDRTPSVGIYRKRNLIRCFVCDSRAYSAIDLVQKVLGCDTRDAINWIASRFTVPSIPKGRHLAKADPFRSVSRVGLGGSLEQVIRSGLWAHLSLSEKAILPVLSGLSDRTKDGLQISYRGIRRFSGVRSDTTVRAALHHFEQIHLLNIHRGGNEGLRASNSYELTLDEPRLLQLMTDIYASEQQEIETERQSREEHRNMRRQLLAKKRNKSATSNADLGSDQVSTPA